MMSYENNEVVQPANGGEIKKQTVNPDSTPNDLYNPDKGSLMADKEYNTQNEMDRIVKDMAPKPSNGGELDAGRSDVPVTNDMNEYYNNPGKFIYKSPEQEKQPIDNNDADGE